MSLSSVVDRIVDVLGLGYEVVCMPYLKREVFTFECFLKTGLIRMNEDIYWHVKYLAWAFGIHSKTKKS